MAILDKVKNYSWEAKAVLTLAAFAMEFGDFWLLAELYKSNPLAKQLAMLKRASVFINPSDLQKRQQAVLELSNLIKTTMRVIKDFDEFEKLSFHSNDIPGLVAAMDNMPVYAYWAIHTIVACAMKVTILTSSSDQ